MKSKANTKKIILMIVVLIIVVILLFLFCNFSKRKCIITGYAFRNEIVRITILNKSKNIVPYRDKEPNGLCFLNEKITYFQFFNPLRLKIQIDSSDIILLDTVLILPNNNKEPVVSIEDPTTNNFKRSVFILDDRDIMKP